MNSSSPRLRLRRSLLEPAKWFHGGSVEAGRVDRLGEMSDVLNIAAYRFAPLERLDDLRLELTKLCTDLGVRGTILLAPEGINLFLAGDREGLERVLERIRAVSRLEELAAKESYSSRQPFQKLLVKIKKEIISFGRAEVAPATYTSRRILPAELKQWLDEGRKSPCSIRETPTRSRSGRLRPLASPAR